MKALRLILAAMLMSLSLFAQTDCIPDFPETQTDSCEEAWDVDTQYEYDDCIDDYTSSTANVILPPHCPADYCIHCGRLVCEFPYINSNCRFHHDHEFWCPMQDDYHWFHPCGYSQVEGDTQVILADNGGSNGV